MPFNIGAPELVLILIVLLVVVGPGKLPEIGSAFGRTLREFRKATSDLEEVAETATKGPKPAAQPNRLAGQTLPNVLTEEDQAEAAMAARNVSPRGTPTDPVEDA